MSILLENVEETLQQEIANKDCTQKDIALTYAFALLSNHSGKEVDFAKLNALILERYSMSGLKNIKNLAWDLYHQKRAEERKLDGETAKEA